jgi:phosphoenolpyruvate-protein kinase (PTS system EI component)
MSSRTLPAVAASPGVALGPVHRLEAVPSGRDTVAEPPAAACERARRALDAAAADLDGTARRLRDAGRAAEAEILDAVALMARDPELRAAAEAVIREQGLSAADALLHAAEEQATLLAALDDPYLAERADDVRSIGRRAAALAVGAGVATSVPADAILVAADLGPADVAELDPNVAGIALAFGGATTHAAIVARSLGLPMVVGAGEDLLSVEAGACLVVDGDAGAAILDPDAAATAGARARMDARRAAHREALAAADLPTVTADGHHVRVLLNAAAAAEARTGLEAGADGIGLLRTELRFLDAEAWPGEDELRRALEPVLALVQGRVATVRVLDFGGDKTPPFLAGETARGIALLLAAPGALDAQLRAILAAAEGSHLRVLLPMVESPEQVKAVRAALAGAAGGAEPPALGAMVETPAGVAAAAELAAACAFLSIGSNDLAHAALGTDRFGPGAAAPFHPRVLRLIRQTVAAAHAAGIPVEVCGEAASDPVAMPLLVGLGVDELSVGASRVATVRAWVRRLHHGEVAGLAEEALGLDGPDAVAELVRGTIGDTLAEAR